MLIYPRCLLPLPLHPQKSEYNDENLRFITELIQIKHAFQESEDNLVQHITQNLPRSPRTTERSPRTTEDAQGRYVVLDFDDKGSEDDEIGNEGCDPSPENSPSTQTIEMMESSFLFMKERTTPCLAPLDDEKSIVDHKCIVDEGETPTPPISPVTSHMSELIMSHMTIPSIAPQSLSKLMMRSVDSEPIMGMGLDQVITSYVFNGVGCNQEMLSISIPADIPLTEVMTENEGDLKAQCGALYWKYIRDGAEYEINIPYATRRDIAAQIESVYSGNDAENNNEDIAGDGDSVGDLFWIFDASCVMIMRLLMASFQRFKCKTYSSPTLTSTQNPHRKGSRYHSILAKYSI